MHMGFISRILAFLVMGALAWIVIGVPASMINGLGSSVASAHSFEIVFLAIALVVAAIAVLAPSARHAWGRLALLNGLACFALPFMAMAASWAATSQITAQANAPGAVAGAAIAGFALAGVTGLFGFFAGLILVIIAYFVLRRSSGGAAPA